MMFFKETNFKKSPIGDTPQEWEVLRISQISKVRRGASPRPINDSRYFSDTGRGWIRIIDVTNTYKYLNSTTQYLSKIGESRSVKVNPGDLIMSICATIGKPIILNMKACIHDGFVWFSELSDGVDTEFLFYVLQRNERKFISMRQTGTQGNLNTTLVGKTFVALPPLQEQKAIADVLSAVDDVIQKTDEVIAKTERLKKGLMQELLTRGIGHKEFKDTEIGRIPKEWEVVRLKEVVLPTENIDPTKEHGKEFKYVDISSIDNFVNKITGWNIITHENAPSRAKKLIKAGDVIFATTRPYLKNIAIVPEELDEQICSTGFCVIRANRNYAVSEWIFYNVLTKQFIIRVSSKMRGATYPAISDDNVLNEKIPLPPLLEQQKIASILSTVDENLEIEREEKAKLQRIKQGLMDLLLTGKVRIKVN
ncbi:restriction endonuclease subunit S [Candidatus Aerophobetes bacterium]|uniref:Restriction endonuclease subunit S n=1 Tax=Aerophobetes bacterium TaxID=2030807 RepID=A0A662DGW0_UNCAE|nr:MAG: restriction endonuclease subunit S [Candidatus Aerophobetes bacterium]